MQLHSLAIMASPIILMLSALPPGQNCLDPLCRHSGLSQNCLVLSSVPVAELSGPFGRSFGVLAFLDRMAPPRCYGVTGMP
jgi:hypothetical protein